MKKGDDKQVGPFPITKIYKRSYVVELPDTIKIFPVFHYNLVYPYIRGGLPGQKQINEAESRNIRGRVLERDDDITEIVEKQEFEGILDYWKYLKDGL